MYWINNDKTGGIAVNPVMKDGKFVEEDGKIGSMYI
jgi:hypothetical protein